MTFTAESWPDATKTQNKKDTGDNRNANRKKNHVEHFEVEVVESEQHARWKG